MVPFCQRVLEEIAINTNFRCMLFVTKQFTLKVLNFRDCNQKEKIYLPGCIYMVVAVGAERFHAICHPLKYKPRPAFYLGFVVLVSILINIPKFLEFKLTSTKYVNQFTDLKKNITLLQSGYFTKMCLF